MREPRAKPLASSRCGKRVKFSRRELKGGFVAADLAMPLLVAPCVWRQLEPFAVKRDPEDKDASIGAQGREVAQEAHVEHPALAASARRWQDERWLRW